MRSVDERKRAFISALRQCENVAEAARSSGLGRRAAYRLRSEDPEFARAWADALSPTPPPTWEPPRWGIEVLALMNEGRTYEEAVQSVAEPALAEAQRDAKAMRAYVEDLARGCA